MSPTALLTLSAALFAAGLAMLAWWIRRRALVPVPARAKRMELRPFGEACPAMLMTAVDTPPETTTGQTTQGGTTPSSGGGGAPRRKPKDDVSRRSFLKWFMGLGAVGAVSALGTASLAFLWPNLRGGFGSQIQVAPEEEILANIEENQGRWEFPQGRTLFVRYDPALDDTGQYADLTGGSQVMALYQRCVHLGCKVPWCPSSQWWECPCHGSRYNRWGEYQAGPAPRGLDRFSTMLNDDGVVVLNTAVVVTGPSRNAGVLDQPPEGPSCL